MKWHFLGTIINFKDISYRRTMIEDDRFTVRFFVVFRIGGKLAVLVHVVLAKVVQQLLTLSIVFIPRNVYLRIKSSA